MNTAVILVTHGNAGAEMIAAAAEKIGAPVSDIAAVGVHIDEPPADIQHRIEDAVALMHAEEFVFLVDLGGSTPFNLCCKSCGRHSVVVSGVNLAMLFKLSTVDRSIGARRLAEELVATGTKSIGLRENQT